MFFSKIALPLFAAASAVSAQTFTNGTAGVAPVAGNNGTTNGTGAVSPGSGSIGGGVGGNGTFTNGTGAVAPGSQTPGNATNGNGAVAPVVTVTVTIPVVVPSGVGSNTGSGARPVATSVVVTTPIPARGVTTLVGSTAVAGASVTYDIPVVGGTAGFIPTATAGSGGRPVLPGASANSGNAIKLGSGLVAAALAAAALL